MSTTIVLDTLKDAWINAQQKLALANRALMDQQTTAAATAQQVADLGEDVDLLGRMIVNMGGELPPLPPPTPISQPVAQEVADGPLTGPQSAPA